MKPAFLLILCLGMPGVAGLALPATLLQETACPECKAKLKPEAKFCTGCGAKIVPKTCAECKAPLKPDAKFCAGCGAKAGEAPKPEEGKKPAENQDPAKPAGRMVDPDAVKQKLDEELRKFGTSSEAVNRAIDRGAAALARHYAKLEMRSEEDYLTAYALI